MSLQLQSYTRNENMSNGFSLKTNGISKTNVVSTIDFLFEVEQEEIERELAFSRGHNSLEAFEAAIQDDTEDYLDADELVYTFETQYIDSLARRVNAGDFALYKSLWPNEQEELRPNLTRDTIIRLDGWLVDRDNMIRLERLLSDRERPSNVYRINAIDAEAETIKRIVDQKLKRYEREQSKQQELTLIDTDIDSDGEAPLQPIKGLAFEVYPKTLVMLVGMSAAGKSYLTLRLAGSMRETGGNVAYWLNEGSKTNMKGRYKAQKQVFGHNPDTAGNMVIMDNTQLPLNLSDDSVTNFIEVMSQHEPALIVIDALTGSYVGDENSNTDLAIVMDSLLRIKDELECVLVVADNTGKDETKGARGGQVKFDKSETFITVARKTRDDGKEYTTATYRKQKYGVAGSKLKFNWQQVTIEQGGVTVSEVVPVIDTEIVWSDEVYDYISEHQPASFTEILEGTKGTRPTVTKWLKNLVEAGILAKDQNGDYIIAS